MPIARCTKTKYGGKGLLQKVKRLYCRATKQGDRRRSSALPRQLLSGVFILEVASKRRRGLGNDEWKAGVSFKSSLQVLCPSCLFMGHMCKFGVGRSVCYLWWIFSL